MKKYGKEAFSLIELSIVILIIGILITGIIQGRDLIEKASIKSARSLTNSSPVPSIQDLLAWYETTSDASFDQNLDITDTANNAVSTWHDINPTRYLKYNMSQSNNNEKPIVSRRAINGLPALFFDGNDDHLINNNLLLNVYSENYSIIAVGESFDILKHNPIFGQYIANETYNIVNHFLRISDGGSITIDHYPPGGSFSTSYTLQNNQKFIITLTRSNNIPKVYLNGDLKGTGTSELYSAGVLPDVTAIGHRIRSSYPITEYFHGYLAEIIIYDRNLKNRERKSVEQYLSQKWGIEVMS